MFAIITLIDTLLAIAFWVIVIQVIMSWLINFNVINLHQPLVRQIWDGLNRLTAPVYGRIRRFLPSMGGLDFAPMIVILGIFFLRNLVTVDLARALL